LRPQSDDGASLVLTMIFVMGVGLVVGGLLTYSQAGIASAKATQSRQLLASDASGAMDTAINSLRNSNYSDGAAQCDPYIPSTVVGASGQVVRLVCKPKAGTGLPAGSVPINSLNHPGSAVLTLATGTEAGLAKSSNGDLRIKGKVYVNSDITVGGSNCTLAQLNTVPLPNCSAIDGRQAAVVAKGVCASGVFGAPLTCSAAGSPSEGQDPGTAGLPNAVGYAPPPSAPTDLVPQTVKPCGTNPSVELDAGYYDDAAALTALTGTCNKPLHFNPGVYFFDFRNEEMAAIPSASRPVPSGTNLWTIDNSSSNFYLVGGTKKDWASGAPTNFPGSCVSPLTTSTPFTLDQGVQFVFGGSSRVDIVHGRVELCGQYSDAHPSLVLYGAKTGATTLVSPLASTATLVSSPIGTDKIFGSPDAARVLDASASTANNTRSASSTTTSSLRLTGMDAASKIPAGSILVSAELRVTHKESANRSGDAIRVSVLPNPSRLSLPPTPSTGTVPLHVSATYQTDPAAMSSSLTNALMKEVWKYGLSDLRIDYSVDAAKSSAGNTSFVSDVDSVQLWLSWKPPSLRGETTPINGSNCVGAVAPATTCALVKTANNGTYFYLQGTTYAPSAMFDIQLTNVSGQVFKSGIIARALAISVTPSASFTGPIIEIPDETVGGSVGVGAYLTAYICPDSVACPAAPPSAGWRRVGRSEISLESGFPVPETGARSVTVSNWHLLE
jgi:hypothetical protein